MTFITHSLSLNIMSCFLEQLNPRIGHGKVGPRPGPEHAQKTTLVSSMNATHCGVHRNRLGVHSTSPPGHFPPNTGSYYCQRSTLPVLTPSSFINTVNVYQHRQRLLTPSTFINTVNVYRHRQRLSRPPTVNNIHQPSSRFINGQQHPPTIIETHQRSTTSINAHQPPTLVNAQSSHPMHRNNHLCSLYAPVADKFHCDANASQSKG